MSTRRGFTVMEVLLALGLGAMLAAAVTAFAWRTASSQRALGLAASDAQGADALLDRLESDLLGAIAGDARRGAGVQGSSTRLRVLTRGVDLSDAGASDLHEAVYEFIGPMLWLARGPAGAPGERHALSERAMRARFRYFDGRSWSASFDSAAAGRLPAAVEVALWFEPVGERAGAPERWPEPDRVRVLVIPDAPEAAWSLRTRADAPQGGAP
jgi:prepilin-type N-terminal cleavage/methylation domain-containing protein